MLNQQKETLGGIPLKPDNSHFTDGQWQAIYDAGDNILVSASAGSGKTTVLVQRVIEKIKSGTNVDELLIVTYTEAAAKEMKGRIQAAVQSAITDESNQELKRHLVEQLSLIPTAHVSTLHAFCLQVIRKYYYLINIDPVFRLLTDETEMILLKEDVWDKVRNDLYADQQEAFYQLTENFSNDRNDDGLTKLIFALYDFARANPDPQAWLESLGKAYKSSGKMADLGIYQEILKPKILLEAEQLVVQGQEMVRLSEGEETLQKPFECVSEELPVYQQLQTLLLADDLEAVYSLINEGVVTKRYPGLRNLEPEEKAINEQIKQLRTSNKDIIKNWQEGIFSLEPSVMLTVMKESQELVDYMAGVASQFDMAYRARKEELNLVDFNDLEHFTLQILAELKDGEWQGTEASNYYRSLFKEVLVDEYQDINQLQESILFWLRQPTSGSGNLFMVGDVKQSIYSFRLADPTLFINKYNKFGEGEDGRRIILAENFRSRGEVLDFTNLVFQQLMDPKLGQLAYDLPAQLVTGFTGYPENDQFKPEVLIFESQTDDTEQDVLDVDDSFQIDDKTEGELRLVGNKIKELFQQEFPIYDKKTRETRPIKYSDIVLLSPTKKNNLVLLDIFKELGIPLQVNDTQNYFQATEIKIMMALLNVIDNPYQDIPLAAVLRSPIVGLKENDLAFIRSQDAKGTFYEAFKAALNMEEDRYNNELLEQLNLFNSQLLMWREMARRKELVQLIWSIYNETGFLDYVGGMPAGKQRQANLHALYQRAASYEEMSFKGLFQFVRFIEKMAEKDKDLAEPTDLSDNQDAVRVMTIHASKGLEFPVVFVLDLTRRFNLMDLNQPYLFDVELGAGIKYLDSRDRLVYKTLPFLAIREAKRNKLLSEEMRKLYVALTRAEEKLFLVGSYKNQEETFKKWSLANESESLVLSEPARLKGRSLMDWIGLTLMRHPKMSEYQSEFASPKISELENHLGTFELTFSNLDDLRVQSQKLDRTKNEEQILTTAEKITKLDTQALEWAKNHLAYSYELEPATRTASYQSVSEIKRVFEDPDNAELLTLDLSEDKPQHVNRYVNDELAKPAFLSEVQEATGAEVGTATHLLMQLLPLDSTPTIDSIELLIADLQTKELISEVVAKKINRQQIINFFQTDFGRQLLERHDNVKREAPFSLLLKANDIYQDYPSQSEDTLLVHGIIDGYIETEEDLILYDFKTDYVPNREDLTEFKNKYSGQMKLYRQALEESKGRKVTAIKLVLLGVNQVIDM
ncbi:helicase-exonuclease AddAB subunit AddA [Vagococcus coleopterorum]|uniref:ATP-dependent helicase/nuclease subunit A n=1 Tax=Vagococcus coleopterorum TaxID=2714946 RepID=A0A6G8AP00_9ENTE|nr:helicase-exonuclease AddAB subunit AddA [Vagococcus coleopterorum]QIL46655.1 helicase-exonuclease AddAB subunit AddA [Vagococcus coleopterorum]